jgi:Leucine-rich repeat (LRR) protein
MGSEHTLYGLEIKELPESIGELESLETLDIRRCGSTLVLPASLAKLRNLVRLFADGVKL